MTVQAILFKKDEFDLKACKRFLNINKIKYLSFRITDTYYRFRLVEPNYKKFIYRIERNYKGKNNIDYIVEIPK